MFRSAAERVKRLDPLLVEAVDDVDLGLLRWSLSLSPEERLQACSRAAFTLSSIRREPETEA